MTHDYGATWSALLTIAASDGAAGDEFGGKLTIYGDLVVVTADKNDNAKGINAGDKV